MSQDLFEYVTSAIPFLGTKYHAKIIYGLVRWLRPQVCVEIGAWRGYVTCHIAQALLDNDETGQLICIDDWSLEAQAEKEIKAGLDALRLRHRVLLHSGKSSDSSLWPEQCDLAVIDGDHSDTGCRADVLKAIELGAQCLVLHDTVDWWGPREVIEEIRQMDWDVLEVNFDCGLGIAIKRSTKPPTMMTKEAQPTGDCRLTWIK